MSVQVARYIESILAKNAHSGTLIIGLNGPQGSGKSTIVSNLLTHFHQTQPSLVVAGVLIDDFYLPHAQQVEVTKKAKMEDNKVLQGRGLPGTHDVELLLEVVRKLRNQEPVLIPVYDKSAFGGEGDRMLEGKWQKFENPVDLVILEGWFNGFRALEHGTFVTAYLGNWPDSVVQKHKMFHLQEVNEQLARFHPVWDAFDYFVFLETDSTDYVYDWRQEQEDDLIEKRGTGMSKEQVRAFVDRYMPMYVLYYWRLCQGGTLSRGRNFRVKIDKDRKVLGTEEV